MIESRAEIFLKSLVDAASPTSEQHQVRASHRLLERALKDLGFQVDWRKDPAGKTADLLIAEKPAANAACEQFITFVSHIDTVLDPKEAGPYRRELHPDGLRARGAGIIDNKGGLAVLVESLRIFLENNPNHDVGLRVVSSPNEEDGSTAWHPTFREIGLQSVAVLGFEPALDDGSIITSRRGNRWYDIELSGIEAHAGRCKGEEINAAFESARLTMRLLNLRDQLRARFPAEAGLGVSIQIGQIEGGRDRHNVVCGKVQMKLDTRFSSFEERKALELEFNRIMSSPEEQNSAGVLTKIQFEIVDDCSPFAADPRTESLVHELCEKIASIENTATLKPSKAGGAGDVNHMSRPGLLILDGLGPVGGRMHTSEEFMKLDTLQTRAEALAAWYPSLIRYARSTLRN
jgi:glutamate carboxypeptidase